MDGEIKRLKKLIPLQTSVTLVEGETFQLTMEGLDKEGLRALDWSSSDGNHVIANTSGKITAKESGTATITVKDPDSDFETKVKVNVIPCAIHISKIAQSMLPIHIEDNQKELLGEKHRIYSTVDLLSLATTKEKRQEIAINTKVNEYTVGLWYKQAAMWQVKGMTKDFAYLAAMAGLRNPKDLARADWEKVKAIFRVLKNNAETMLGDRFIMPSQEEIEIILENAKRMNEEETDYYTIMGEGDEEPAFLFGEDSQEDKTDSEVLQEGLAFLQNIKLALPLPKTISGVVKIKESTQTDEKALPKAGCKVRISGIANPARDKSEDDEELFCYTGGDGKFSIVMPDRYNMQEAVNITIIENKNESYVPTYKTADEGAGAVHQMSFVKRASEIMNAEYIEVENKETGMYEKKYARNILGTIDTIERKNKELTALEKELLNRALTAYEMKKQEEKLKESEQKYKEYERDLRAEVAYHKCEKEKQIEELEKELVKIRVQIEETEETERKEKLKQLKQELKELEKISQKYKQEDVPIDIQQRIWEISEEIHVLEQRAGKKNSIENTVDEKLFFVLNNEISAELQEKINYYNQLLNELDLQKMYYAQLKESYELTESEYSELKAEHERTRDFGDEEGVADEIELRDPFGAAMLKLSLGALEECYDIFEPKRLAYEEAKEQYFDLKEAQTKLVEKCESVEKKELFKQFLSENKDDMDIIRYESLKVEVKTRLEEIYDLDETNNDIQRTVLNILSGCMDADLGTFILCRDVFEGTAVKPRALPSVKLMGNGDEAVYLPTDTAPSRMFNYYMIQRLVDPKISKDNQEYKRSKLTGAIDVMSFKKNLSENQEKIAIARTLGIGYVLNMHQAWVPDGFSLGNLLYSLVLAPGEEQRIIVREHKESYTVDDRASAIDTINDSYQNSQQDNETAAFSNAVDRYSNAHTDSNYYSSTSSKGSSGLGFFFGIGVSSSASSINKGSSASNAYQSDTYDEVSSAAQNFQSSIKTESDRIAMAKRASISIASSDETESVSSKIIANHNHSHVMTVQYWEVMRRYKMETCIEGVELVLFVPLKLINFMPDKNNVDYKKQGFQKLELNIEDFSRFTKDNFIYRYGNILQYADILSGSLPVKYHGGLELMRKYAAYPKWKAEDKLASDEKVVELKLSGYFMEFDDVSATLYFNNGKLSVCGEVEEQSYISIHPSMNTRKDVLYAMRKIRNGKSVIKNQNEVSGHASVDYYTEESVEKQEIVFRFYLPSSVSRDDISHIYVKNTVSTWEYHLSQSTVYMEDSEIKAIERYENKLNDLYKDDDDSKNDIQKIAHYREGLPECYVEPIASFSKSELVELGGIEIKAAVNVGGISQTTGANVEEGKITVCNREGITAVCSAYKLGTSPMRIDIASNIPVLGYNEIMQMEETLRHVASDTLHYSQVVWSCLTDNERIMLLEPYTIDLEGNEKWGKAGSNESINISLLSCVNAKKLLGFYGNCMMLPFTYPEELAEVLGKTAADIQDELYRYHTSNFRVPSTVVSVPTDGMVGEAVLGATNVSEKIDITRFWNWKDSEIDHMEIDQSSLNGNSILSFAQSKSVDAPTVGVAATEHIANSNLLNALLSRPQATFADVLANTDLRELMKTADTNASNGRDNVVKANTDILKTAVTAAADAAKAIGTSGLSELGKLGDTDLLTGAMSALGLDAKDAESLVKQFSDGKMSVSDLLQKVVNGGKQSGMGTREPGGNNNEGSGENTTPAPGESEGEEGQERPPLGGEDEVENADNQKEYLLDAETVKEFVDYAIAGLDEGRTLEETFNKWLHENFEDSAYYFEPEIEWMAKEYCKEKGVDFDSLVSYVQSQMDEAE